MDTIVSHTYSSSYSKEWQAQKLDRKNNEREKGILKLYRVRGFPESRKYPLILMASYPEVFSCLQIIQITRQTEVVSGQEGQNGDFPSIKALEMSCEVAC